jgi:hypothetical protein
VSQPRREPSPGSRAISNGYTKGPNNTDAHPPEYCPPTPECLIVRLQENQNRCFQPQGLYEPIVCAPGHYCPSPGKEQILCPKGHYCPVGSASPRKCMPLTSCPAGTDRQVPFLGILCCVLLDIVLVCIWLWPRIRRDLNANRQQSRKSIESALETQPVPCSEAKFAESNELELGSFLLNEAWDAGLTLEFNNVTLRNPKSGGHILLAVSGKAKKGSLLGVMGPSGSGKSACPPHCAALAETNTGNKQHLPTYSPARSELHPAPFR